MLRLVAGRVTFPPPLSATSTPTYSPERLLSMFDTVPTLIPALLFTVKPVTRPVSEVTPARARALLGLAWTRPLIDACAAPWLRTLVVTLLVVRTPPDRLRLWG